MKSGFCFFSNLLQTDMFSIAPEPKVNASHLRKQLAMKERNLKIRNVTWVFKPVPQFFYPSNFFCSILDS